MNETVESEQAKVLPAGWNLVSDEAFGKYYYHEATGATMFGHPNEVIWKDWAMLLDRSSNAQFYYNQVTGESTWEIPDGFFLPTQPQVEDISPGNQEEEKNKLADGNDITSSSDDAEFDALLEQSQAICQKSDSLLSQAAITGVESASSFKPNMDVQSERPEREPEREEQVETSKSQEAEGESRTEEKEDDSGKQNDEEEYGQLNLPSTDNVESALRGQLKKHDDEFNQGLAHSAATNVEEEAAEATPAEENSTVLTPALANTVFVGEQEAENEIGFAEEVERSKTLLQGSESPVENAKPALASMGKSLHELGVVEISKMKKTISSENEELANKFINEFFETSPTEDQEDETPGFNRIDSIFIRSGDQIGMSALARMQQELNDRQEQKQAAERETEEKRLKEELRRKREKEPKVTEWMKREWALQRSYMEKKRINGERKVKQAQVNMYFEKFWTEESSKPLTNYEWGRTKIKSGTRESRVEELKMKLGKLDAPVESESQDLSKKVAVNSIPALHVEKVPEMEKKKKKQIRKRNIIPGLGKRLPNPVTSPSWSPLKEPDYLLSTRVAPGTRSVGTYKFQIHHNYAFGDQAHHEEGGVQREGPVSIYLPPVSPLNGINSCLIALGNRPCSVGELSSTSKWDLAAELNTAERVQSAGRRKSSSSISRKSKLKEPPANELSDALHRHVDKALQDIGDDYETLRGDVMRAIIKTHHLRVHPSTVTNQMKAKHKKKKRKPVQQKQKPPQKLQDIDGWSEIVSVSTEEASEGRFEGEEGKEEESFDDLESTGLGMLEEASVKSKGTASKLPGKPSRASVSGSSTNLKKGGNEQSLLELFSEMDTSGDGYVSLKELKKAVKDRKLNARFPTLSIPSNDALWDVIFQSMDIDSSGDVSLEEFIRVFGRAVGESKEDREQRRDFRSLFDLMDNDGDGSISVYELRHSLRSDPIIKDFLKQSPVLQPLLRASAFNRILSVFFEFDEDGSGFLEWPEFERVCETTFEK